MKDTDDAIIFRSQDFKKAVSPCRQELQSPNFDTSKFRGTSSIKTTLIMMTSSLKNHVILVKYCSSLSGKAIDEIWAAESAADSI